MSNKTAVEQIREHFDYSTKIRKGEPMGLPVTLHDIAILELDQRLSKLEKLLEVYFRDSEKK